MRISQVLVIRNERAAVFRRIEDPELACAWQPEVAGYEITKETADRVGTEFRELLRDAKGAVELRGRITAYVPDALMAFELVGRGLRVRVRYGLTSVARGTELRVDADVRIGGPLWWLLEPFLRRRIVAQHRTELLTLRDLCEADASDA